MSVISGVAKNFDGTAIDYVSIFNWTDGKGIAQIAPDANGAWEYKYYSDLNIGVTYVDDGCEPITHGPYNFAPVFRGYRWWRFSNIQIRLPDTGYATGSASQIVFRTDSGAVSNEPSKGIAAYSRPNLGAENVFDGNPNTNTYSGYVSQNKGVKNWWIGYVFDEPEAIVEVQLQMWQGMEPAYGQEWQTADIDYSDDGINWVKYGTIEPRIAAMDLSLITTSIIKI